jgi:site-specific DNA-methyltransferase (cytosine-N4-specific)
VVSNFKYVWLGLLKTPLATVLAELKSGDRYIAGLALEALAFKLMRLLDMTYVATRLRASATGGAEVDLIFESARLVFSRWQVQCKNTSRVSLDDVAKEVGLTHFLKSDVIVIVSTGNIGSGARSYADAVVAKLRIHICCLGGDDLRTVSESPAALPELVSAQAPLALSWRRPFPIDDGRNEDGGSAVFPMGARV